MHACIGHCATAHPQTRSMRKANSRCTPNNHDRGSRKPTGTAHWRRPPRPRNAARPRATQQHASFHTYQPQPAKDSPRAHGATRITKPTRLRLHRSRAYYDVTSMVPSIHHQVTCLPSAHRPMNHTGVKPFAVAAAPAAALLLYESQQGMHVPRSPSHPTSHACQPALAARSPSATLRTTLPGCHHCRCRSSSVHVASLETRRRARSARALRTRPHTGRA